MDRKGIKYLQDNGVEVHLFDRDLQEEIHTTNREFVDQAHERAAKARETKKTEPVVLSILETTVDSTELEDFDSEALDGYRKMSGISHGIDTPEFQHRMVLQGLVRKKEGKLAPTGFGLLLFGREPRISVPQAGLLGTMHFADGREETRDFDGPAVALPGQALQWLKNKLPDPITRAGVKRKEVNETLYELLREGIVNALVHRDYGIEGAKCQLVVYPKKIMVLSPGLPVEPITMEQLEVFDAPMLSRNPLLHFVFAKMRLAEEGASGSSR